MDTNVFSATSRSLAGAMALLVLLAACGEDAAQTDTPAATSRPAKGATGTDETKGMVAGVTDEKKKGAPVDLRFELKARPALNVALPIEVAFVPRQASDMLRATFLAPEGISVSQSPVPAEYRNVQPQGVYRHTLTVVPKQDGVYYVTAIVVMNTGTGAAETRTFQIPILVGAPEDATGATAETGAGAATAAAPATATDPS